MASEVDATIPADNVKANKAEFRENFRIIRDEITEQQRLTGIAWKIAVGELSL